MNVDPTDLIWMNGDFVAWENAKVHVLTHGLHYGTGVFEGVRCYDTELGRTQQAVDVLGVAEHGGPELGVVAADPLEHAGAVVQPVRQDVDLGVLTGDEISVHPDEVGGIHVH